MTEKVTKIKAEKKAKPKAEKKATWLNNVFEIFMGNNSIFGPPIMKLRKNLSNKAALDLEKYILQSLESIECKAYLKRKKDIIETFKDEQAKIEDPKDKKPTTLENMPELMELLNMESGFYLDKYEITPNDFLPDLSNILIGKIKDEKAKKKPNLGLITRYEEQLLQERERLLTGDDFIILNHFFEFK